MVLTWITLITLSVWSWLVVYSLYVELRDLSKLEDLAHLRVSKAVKCVLSNDLIVLIFADGNDGLSTCINKSIVGWLTSNNTTFHHSIDYTLKLIRHFTKKSRNQRNTFLLQFYNFIEKNTISFLLHTSICYTQKNLDFKIYVS